MAAKKKTLVPAFAQDALVDYFVAHPLAAPDQAAEHFKASPSYIYAIINSDLFKARVAEQRRVIRENVVMSVSESMTGLLHQALDRLAEQVEVTADPGLLLDIVETLSKRRSEEMGNRSLKGGDTVNVQNNAFFASADAINAARETLKTLQPPVLEHDDAH